MRAEETAPQVGEYSIEARIKGVYARVTTEFTITNNNSRTFEGELEFPLPESGVVCGYSIDIDGVMTEGSVVEKEKARIAFENEVKRGADPGIVEQVSGNIYRTRIYPIPGKGQRRIRLEYITPLTIGIEGSAALWLPMPSESLSKRDVVVEVDIAGAGVPTIGGLGDRRFAQAQAVWRVEAHETNVKGEDHLLIGIPALPDCVACVEQFDNDYYFCASVKVDPIEKRESSVIPKAWRILWDASGSRKPGDIAKARRFIELLPEDASFELWVFSIILEEVKYYHSRKALLEAIDSVIYDGATQYYNLPTSSFDGMTLLFSDGFETFSKYPQTQNVPEFGENTAVIVSGVKRNTPVLSKIGAGRILDLDILRPEEAFEQILAPSSVVAAVKGDVQNVEGIGLPAVGRVSVLGRVNAKQAACEIVLSDGRNYTFALDCSRAAAGNTIASAWAARRIASLSPNSDDREVREELLALGRHFSIVSPVSSMIVFERLDQWVQYDIEPPKSNPNYNAWMAQHKNKQKTAENKQIAWEKELYQLWEGRLAWWKDPIPKSETPKSGLFDRFSNAVGGAVGAVRGRLNQALGSVAPGAVSSGSRMTAERMGEAVCSEPVVAATGGARREMAPMMGGAAGIPSMLGMAAPMMVARAPQAVVTNERAECEEACCDEACCAPSVASASGNSERQPSATACVEVKAWDPETPYITAIKDAGKIFHSDNSYYEAYLKQRKEYALSPSFYLDCANFFFNLNKFDIAVRILSNLAELKLDDVSLLRVFGWRLREAGAYEYALSVLNIVKKLRPDEAVSWRDLALTFTLAAKAASAADEARVIYAEKALECYHHAAFSPCERSDAKYTAIVALEEFNIFADWCDKQKWEGKKPVIPEVEEKYRSKFDLDLRIVLMWDTDDTDIDLHVLEPSGEEVYYSHKRSVSGGILSYDVTTGYGPEEYLHKKAPAGKYRVLSNYYASHQQKLTGPTTVTATIFTNWGRENEESQTMSLRLEKAKDNHEIGCIEVK